jgi:hypothetical protein
MKLPNHPIFRLPASLFWLLPLLIVQLLFLQLGEFGSLWWYIATSPFVVLAIPNAFTSVWFGVSVLATLFIYCSIGSAGFPISFAIWEPATWVNLREMRGLEMTEFEWFHWWPFKMLVTILCLNMATVTLLKIPLNILSVGVWSIHCGVITMVLGSVVYFSNKVEGDVLISRSRVVIEIPNAEPVSMVVTPNNSITIGDTSYSISNINPNWELMSGEDSGQVAYAVSVSIVSPTESFTRQMIAGYPQYTEDVIRTDDPAQPMARAIKAIGRALVDEDLVMRLELDAKDKFYLTQSGALYIRELSPQGVPLSEWAERPIVHLPRFNDYIAKSDDVWMASNATPQLHPLDINVPSTKAGDPIAQPITIRSYLRYAYMDTRIIAGGETQLPVAWFTLRRNDAVEQSIRLFAFEPSLNTADTSIMSFEWVGSDSERLEIEQSMVPKLKATILGVTHDLTLTNSPEFSNIGDTNYSYRVKSIQNNLNISNNQISLAEVELQRGDTAWLRWVFDNPELNRDVIEDAEHDDVKFIDSDIVMSYQPGGAPITVVGGQRDGSLVLLTSLAGEAPASQTMPLGSAIALTNEVTLTLDRVEQFTTRITRPAVVPQIQRDPVASNAYSMVLVEIPTEDGVSSAWLQYHPYPFGSITEVVHRFEYRPTTLLLKNNKVMEVVFSRTSQALPAPIALDRFEIDSHLGGFSGRTSSILDWRSIVQILDGKSDPMSVSVNEPKQYQDYWFFQSQWDPPDSTSAGLNYTVLGVGNRHGVFIMLLGCCLAVSGMIWAFFVKPMIKRKRQRVVYSQAAA